MEVHQSRYGYKRLVHLRQRLRGTQITRSDDEARGDKPRDACSGRSGGCLPLSIVSYPSHCSCEAGAMVLTIFTVTWFNSLMLRWAVNGANTCHVLI